MTKTVLVPTVLTAYFWTISDSLCILYLQDGTLRCIDVTNDTVKVLDTYSVGTPITSLDFSTNWSHLNIGSSSGCMHTYDVNAPGSVKLVMNEHNGNFIGVESLAPGLEHAVVSSFYTILCELYFWRWRMVCVYAYYFPVAAVSNKDFSFGK